MRLRRLIQNLADLLGQSSLCEGFHEQLHVGIQPTVVHDRVARVTGGEENLDRRPSLLDFVGELAAVDAVRQTDVGEQQVEIGLPLQHTQG